MLDQAIARWQKDAPTLAEWAKSNLPEGFAVFDYPPAHSNRLRTTNVLKRINRELKRRTRLASMARGHVVFPYARSCLRLVSALLAECDEDWMTGKIYLTMKP